MVIIRPARVTDAGELLTVQRAAYLSEGARHDSFTLPPLIETLPEIEQAIRAGGVLVAVAGSRIVGAVRATVRAGTCHVGRLAVAPDRQGQGIGRRLIAEVEARYDTVVDRYELFTGPRSDANLRLYRRLGYRDMPTPIGAEPLRYLEKPVSGS